MDYPISMTWELKDVPVTTKQSWVRFVYDGQVMGKHGKAMSGDINTPGWQIRKVHPPMAAIW